LFHRKSKEILSEESFHVPDIDASVLYRGGRCRRRLTAARNRSETPQEAVAREDRRVLRELYFASLSADGDAAGQADDAPLDAGWQPDVTGDAIRAGVPVQRALLSAPLEGLRLVQAADHLIPEADGGYGVVLVRPLVRLRGEVELEAAFAAYLLRQNGSAPAHLRVVFARRNYVRGEHLDPKELLQEGDIGRRARAVGTGLEEQLTTLPALMKDDPIPGDYHCGDLRCDVCNPPRHLLPTDHVRHLLHGRETAEELMDLGVTRMEDIPADFSLTTGQRRQVDACRRNRIHFDRERLRAFLELVTYPVGFLDFEAVSRIVPRLPGIRVGQHVPFLYSLHQAAAPDRLTSHVWAGEGDVAPESFTESLLESLAAVKSILAFGAGFERRMLSFLGDRVPAYAGDLEKAAESIVDLAVPFQRVLIYHPEQRGGLSLKRIAWALAGVDYDDLGLADGGDANSLYASAQDAAGVSEELMTQLVAYCSRDTRALGELFFSLERLVGSHR